MKRTHRIRVYLIILLIYCCDILIHWSQIWLITFWFNNESHSLWIGKCELHEKYSNRVLLKIKCPKDRDSIVGVFLDKHTNIRSSHRMCSLIKVLLKIFKKETLAQAFSRKFCEISKNTFLKQNTSGWLLLKQHGAATKLFWTLLHDSVF